MFAAIGRFLGRLVSWSGWRDLLARLPLPMLALAASYGVYRFALMFVPEWVAIVQAAAFELVYMGLAVARLTPEQQKRAKYISIGSVVTSILYNCVDGLFHRRPDLLANPSLWFDIPLALLHGVPLALLAYLVADLLLHQSASAPAVASAQNGNGTIKTLLAPEPIKGGRAAEYSIAQLLLSVDGEETFNRDLIVDRLRCSEATATRLLTEAVSSGQVERIERGLYRLGGV